MRKEPLVVYDYGEYDRLFASSDLKRSLKTLNEVARRLRTRYWIIGGAAVYLHVKNPPEDMPDIDVLLDADKETGGRFVDALVASGFRTEMREEDAPGDMFAALRFRSVNFDIFTSQETRRTMRRTMTIRGQSVEAVEPLIVEKIIRASYEDVLMAVDLLANAPYDRRVLWEIARQYRAWGKLAFLEKIARSFNKGVWSADEVRRLARRFSKSEGEI